MFIFFFIIKCKRSYRFSLSTNFTSFCNNSFISFHNIIFILYL
nr:MAG TPA: hypothetical protein [Crassvirales sp.]